MRQFVVPQFIDVEDKIIGPITTRQFIILIFCGLFLFIEYKLSDMVMFIVVGLPTFAIFGIIAFLRINGMPFHYFFLNIVDTLKRPNKRVWSREVKIFSQTVKLSDKAGQTAPVILPRKTITSSRLSDLSLLVDTGGIYGGIEAKGNVEFKTEKEEEDSLF